MHIYVYVFVYIYCQEHIQRTADGGGQTYIRLVYSSFAL